MQRTHRHGAPLALVLASASALACSSDHYIGDLELPVATPEEETTAIDVADADFRVAPNLMPPDISMDTERWPSWPGYGHTSGLGDIDGDGYDDYASIGNDRGSKYSFITVRYGAPRPGDFAAEFAYVYGGSRLSGSSDYPQISGVAPAGDIDADGYADLLVSLGYCSLESGPEGAYLLYGGPSRLPVTGSLDASAVFLPRPPRASLDDTCGSFRMVNTGVGDVDADGFGDFIISENRRDAGLAKAFLFYGSAERLVSGTSWLDADLRLLADQRVLFTPLGDIDADGFADLVIEVPRAANQPPTFTLLRGRAERFEGDQIITSLGVPFVPARPAGDLDADGTEDVLLYDDAYNPHLFYGGTGRFDAGADLASADATFLPYPGQTSATVLAVGDLDADGDAELAARFFDQWMGAALRGVDQWGIHTVAFISGSRTRLSGAVAAPAPSAPFPRGFSSGPGMDDMFSLGDVDGDGASDLLTNTQEYSYDPIEGWRPGSGYYQSHIHFGIRGGAVGEPPR